MNAPALLTSPAFPALVRLPLSRNIAISTSVVVLHVAALWALQTGLLRQAAELVVPAEILTRIIEIEPPKVTAPPPPLAPPKPAPKTPRLPPPPMPVAIQDPLPTPNAPTGVVEPQPPAAPIAVPVALAPAPPAPPPAPRLVEITPGETEYILPPRPVYPLLSKRLGESGVVIVAVYYSAAGYAKRADVFKSSSFGRLDRAARDAVMASQVTPFRRVGVTENTQFLLKAPINFVLE